ncbi:MAG TPA: PEGA domain-containing protein [Kofleriaceae bacterium]|jgi:hypothetical protein
MRSLIAAIAIIAAASVIAHADPDPKRKVVVLEYRSHSSALKGIAARIQETMGKQTSLQLLGLDQTRTQYGADLDAALVKCAGEADCLAGIGHKVGASDVVLVAVSELGDVILTIQRIDVSQKKAVTRIADSLPAGAEPTEDQINGYLARLLAPTDFMRYGVIDIVANLPDAIVTVGNQSRGKTPIKPLKLPAPAEYVVKIEKEGYESFTSRINLPPDGELKVEANLSLKGGERAWYAHWYVLVPAGIIVAGATGATIYYVTRSGPSDTVPVMGTIE